MAGRTLKSLISRRRRAEDEGEDDEGPVLVEDSQSEGSILSEPDEEDGNGSSLGEPSTAYRGGEGVVHDKPEAPADGAKSKNAQKSRKRTSKKSREGADASQSQAQSRNNFKVMTDTDAMMNGLKISERAQADEIAVDFENMDQVGTATTNPATTNGHPITPAERQRREHEEYKKKRDANPAFIPNRGNFFMHDTRGQPNGQAPPPRGAWAARGRSKAGVNVGGPFSPINQVAQAERAAEQPWKHDLHEAINEEPQTSAQAPVATRPADTPQQQHDSARLFPKPAPPRNHGQHRALSFNATILSGKGNVRVFMPGMKAPMVFSDVLAYKHIRLPDHRPPLRRDKPVRVCIQGHNQRYVFPQTDRSFIFIPRQMRPNQQAFHRGHYQRSVGGYGYSSRRTSMYGGSMYSGSVAASRRSSFAGGSRENAFSPVGSFVGMPPSRPVVRLPHNAQQYSAASTPTAPLSGYHTPVGVPQLHTYPLPQQPQFQGTPTTTVHQPRPQKTISVNDIESPAVLQQPQAAAEPQPFQNQLPAHMNEQPAYPQEPPPPYFSPRQQHQYPPSQPQVGTPLSGIPEQALHVPSFQPPGYGQQPPFYMPYAPQQSFYYSPPATDPGPSQTTYPPMPMYMMQPPQSYMVPAPAPPMPPQQPPPQQARPSSSGEEQPQSGMVAHESNGMVFYVPASEAQQSEQYQPAESFVPSYAMPGLPPPTPAPENQMVYYYPQMPPPSGMQEVGTAVYYPAQQ